MEDLKMYCFKRKDKTKGHKNLDDVAIILVKDKRTAVRIFNKYYKNVSNDEVFMIKNFKNDKDIAILTDY